VERGVDYYPFGLTFNAYARENTVPNKFLYNDGSELQTDLSLDIYDTPYRGYDAALGRFMQIDPLADYFPGISPYNYAYNNPIAFNDPTGLSATQSPDGNDILDPSIRNSGIENCTCGCGGMPPCDKAIWLDEFVGVESTRPNSPSPELDAQGRSRFAFFGLDPNILAEISGDAIVQQESVILDINGNVKTWGENANRIYVDLGSGRLESFHTRLAWENKMSLASFSNGLLNITNGMKLPNGSTFDSKKLVNGKIALALTTPDGKFMSYEGGNFEGNKAHFNRVDGLYKITYENIGGQSLTVQSIRAVLGIHEYYVHGVLGLQHGVTIGGRYNPRDDKQIESILQNYPPY
jgi:RHS repeat-associated protein